jgi:hypothetical protein
MSVTYFREGRTTDFEICLVDASERSGDNHSTTYGTSQHGRLLLKAFVIYHRSGAAGLHVPVRCLHHSSRPQPMPMAAVLP